MKEIIARISKHKKPVHIDDLIPQLSAEQKSKLISKVDNMLSKMGGSGKKKHKGLLSKLKRFAQGKTRVKPSDIVSGISLLAKGADLAGVPFAGPISQGTSIASSALKLSGRGSKSIVKLIHDYPKVSYDIFRSASRDGMGSGERMDKLKEMLKSAGLTSGIAAAKMLFNFAMKHPDKAQKLIDIVMKIGMAAYSGQSAGGLRLIGEDPEQPSGMEGEGMCCDSCKGQGLGIAGKRGSGKKPKMRKGMIVGSRREVWDPAHPAQITGGGLTKDGLCKSKGGRIVSKKKSESAKKTYSLQKHQFAKRS